MNPSQWPTLPASLPSPPPSLADDSPRHVPKTRGATPGGLLGLSGGTLAGVASLFTVVTVAQAGCGSSLPNGSYSGVDLLTQPHIFLFGWLFWLGVIIAPLFAGLGALALGVRGLLVRQYALSLRNMAMSGLAIFAAGALSLTFILRTTSGKISYSLAFFVLLAGAALGAAGLLMLLRASTSSRGLQPEERRFEWGTWGGVSGLFLSVGAFSFPWLPFLFTLKMVETLPISSSGIFYVLLAIAWVVLMFIALLIGHWAEHANRMAPIAADTLFLARLGCALGYGIMLYTFCATCFPTLLGWLSSASGH